MWPYRPWGSVPEGVSIVKLSSCVVEVCPSQTSLRSAPVVDWPPKIIICLLLGSQTAECELLPAGPCSAQTDAVSDCVTVRFVETEISSAAVIVETHTSPPVANPWLPDELLMVATVSVPEVQVTELVMFCVLPSDYVPVAVNC